jgi:hypothetical protein
MPDSKTTNMTKAAGNTAMILGSILFVPNLNSTLRVKKA